MRQNENGLWVIDEESIAEARDLALENGGGVVGCLPRKTQMGELQWEHAGKLCCAPMAAEYLTIPPESEWTKIVDDMAGRWPADIADTHGLPDMDQGSNPLCWLFSLADTMRTERVCEGLPYIELAPESGIGASNGRNTGWYCDSALAYVARHGLSAREYVPRDYDLKSKNWKEGWDVNAKLHVPLEVWDGGAKSMTGELLAAMQLRKSAYAWADQWSHAFKLDKYVREGNKIYPSGPNSWGPNQRFILKMRVSGFFVVRSMTSSLK
ncbi:MAG: hypothetical protein KKB31_08000 [Nanoarchaeota archaeon]|nr:hypothetical protein [Nanoarchaeota archaeon]